MNLTKNHIVRYGLVIFAVIIAHTNFLFPKVAENPDSNFIYPFLSKINSPWEYLSQLTALETIDFQPIRDLTLFVDVWFENRLGLNVSIFLNTVIWAYCCCLILSIIIRFFKRLDEMTAVIVVSCYSVYPIFLQTINWGISRKHLLAFMFTLLATKAFLEWFQSRTGQFKIVVFYTLSVLSLPISVGWPVWCLCYLWLIHRDKLKEGRKLISLLVIIMLLLVTINVAYYNTSSTYLQLYPKKANLISVEFIALNLGQHFWQLIYPYNLAFHYTFRNGAVTGFILFLALLTFAVVKLRERKLFWAWLLFAAAHVSIILTTPTIYFDTYLLSPSFAFLMIIILLVEDKLPSHRFFLIPLFIFWTGFTLSQNANWGESEVFFTKSFAEDESCPNAIGLGFAKYSKGKKLPDTLFNFIQVNSCFSPWEHDSPAMSLKKLIFESMSLYFEDDIDYDYRMERLVELGAKHFFPLTVYATILSKENRDEEIERTMKHLNDSFSGTGIKMGKDMIFMRVMPAYCKEKQLHQCMKFIEEIIE
jgi:hypothetical protein